MPNLTRLDEVIRDYDIAHKSDGINTERSVIVDDDGNIIGWKSGLDQVIEKIEKTGN